MVFRRRSSVLIFFVLATFLAHNITNRHRRNVDFILADVNTTESRKCQNSEIRQVISPSTTVRAIFEEADEFLKGLERLGKRLRQYRNTRQWRCQQQRQRQRRRVVNIQEEGYFHKVNLLSNVYTLKFQTAKCQLVPYLAKTYYDYSSNNCSEILNKANPSSKNEDCSRCKENIEETTDASPIQDKDLSIGLPPRAGLGPDGVTWAFIHVVTDAIVDEKGNILTADGRLEPFQCYRKWQPRCEDGAEKKLRHFDELFTIKSLWSTYYHTTIDQFARLALYKHFLVANPQIVLHYSAAHPFQGLIGLSGRRATSGTVHARVVYAPGATPCGIAALFQTQLFSAMLRSTAAAPASRRYVILIKRTIRRYFLYHDDIMAMLEKHSAPVGFQVKVFADDPLPSVRQTRDMFTNAAFVVAPHGAGESNIVLCTPRTVLIEGLCRDDQNRLTLCYRNLARILGMHYHGIVPRQDCLYVTAEDIEVPFVRFLRLYVEGRL